MSGPALRINPNPREGDSFELARTVRLMATPLAGKATVEDIVADTTPSVRSSTLAKLTGSATADEANIHAAVAWILDRMAEKGWA